MLKFLNYSSFVLLQIFILHLNVSLCAKLPSSSSSTEIQNDNKIVGGVEADPHEFPHIVTIRDGRGFCGGSIISPDWVLTAAHCCVHAPATSFTVTGGVHSLSKFTGSEVVRKVSSIHFDQYSPYSGRSDVALLRLSEPFEFNTNISSIDLPESGFIPSGTSTVCGWGVEYEESKHQPDILRKVTIPIIPTEPCRAIYQKEIDEPKFQMVIDESVVCAGGDEKSSCYGDSGGPLMCKNKDGKQILCGTVSSGKRCGETGLYENVGFVRDWITKTMNTQYNTNDASISEGVSLANLDEIFPSSNENVGN